jgi:hypothetical protein
MGDGSVQQELVFFRGLLTVLLKQAATKFAMIGDTYEGETHGNHQGVFCFPKKGETAAFVFFFFFYLPNIVLRPNGSADFDAHSAWAESVPPGT